MSEQFRPLPAPLRVIPEPRGVIPPADAHHTRGYLLHKRRANPAALFFSMLVTVALLGLLLLTSGIADRVPPVVDSLIVMPVTQTPVEEEEPPESQEEPVDQPEVKADSPEEASPASSEPAFAPAPAPALPDIRLPEPTFSPIRLPEVPVTGEARTVTAGTSREGDEGEGAMGPGGQGGTGIAGSGSGGAGKGNGNGNRLFASWGPDMDFSILEFYYPRAARNAKIEGTAWLSCFVPRFGDVRECNLLRESPEGHGFGKAALRAKRNFRIRVHNQAGRRIYNEWVTVRSHFILPDAADGEAQASNVVSIVADEP